MSSYPSVTHASKPGWLGYICETPWGLEGICADVMWLESPIDPKTDKPYPLPLFPQRYSVKDLTIKGTIALDESPDEPEAEAVEHTCHAVGCDRPVEPKYLMCSKHWAMVPANLQTQVQQLYRPGQEVDKNPSPGYLNAARAAIAAVQRKEEAAA
ncbi:hypothetical protein NDA01_21795 [Trichocoleus desertorum AS-A10]|uniref:hypothetical protein n=1 Tax=Trichocoleus desertorum TaxID=1481672 RepID=UPI0032984ED7